MAEVVVEVAVVARLGLEEEMLEVGAAFVAAIAKSRSFGPEEASSEAYFASFAGFAIVDPQVVVELAFGAEVIDYSQTYCQVQRHSLPEGVWLANTHWDSGSCEGTRNDTRS